MPADRGSWTVSFYGSEDDSGHSGNWAAGRGEGGQAETQQQKAALSA